MAQAAARATGTVSAALLVRAGQGMASQPVLCFLQAAAKVQNEQEALLAVETIARLGSTSGHDILVGIYFGLLDAAAMLG